MFPGGSRDCRFGASPVLPRDKTGLVGHGRIADYQADGGRLKATGGGIRGVGWRHSPALASGCGRPERKATSCNTGPGAGRKAPTRKLTLGAVGKLTPDEARTLARKAVGSIAHGARPGRQARRRSQGPHSGANWRRCS